MVFRKAKSAEACHSERSEKSHQVDKLQILGVQDGTSFFLFESRGFVSELRTYYFFEF